MISVEMLDQVCPFRFVGIPYQALSQ